MSSEHPDQRTADPADDSARTLSVPRWAVIAVALVALVPVLIMSAMMLMMGWFGPPMRGGMAASGPGVLPIVGLVPLLLALGVIYGVYRLYEADKE